MLKFWFWLTVLFVVIKINVFCYPQEYRNEFKCPSDLLCDCSIGTRYEIACSMRIHANITLHVEPKPLTNHVKIECNSMNAEFYSQLPKLNIGNSNAVKFNNCPMTLNTSVKRIFDQLNFQNVIDLEINSSKIKEMSSNLLEYLSTIKSIIFNGNRLNSFPQQLFNSNKAIEKIKMSNNQMISNTLPNELFGQLPRLETVWINSCNLISIPSDLFVNSTNIKSISLACNNLTNIPSKMLNQLSNLLDLDLSFNDLISLDDDTFNENINLTVLRLSHNRFNNISR